jgi:hypothetical protein
METRSDTIGRRLDAFTAEIDFGLPPMMRHMKIQGQKTSRPRRFSSGELCVLLSCSSVKLGITAEQYSNESLRNLTTGCLSMRGGNESESESFRLAQNR